MGRTHLRPAGPPTPLSATRPAQTRLVKLEPEHKFEYDAHNMLVTQSYRYALDPTPRQQGALASHCGAARFAYNWGLTLVKQCLEQRAAGLAVEVPWTLPSLRWAWNRAKHQAAPWWPQNSKEAYSSGLDALARALKNWSDSTHGKRKGPQVGFPRFKGKRRSRLACRFTTGGIRVEPDRQHVVLPRIGRIKTHESTRKLARRLEAGTARILNATIAKTADRWYISFTVEVHRAMPSTASTTQRHGGTVGVDVGIRHLAVLSTGETIANPHPLDHAQRRLRQLNRQLARRRGPRAPDGARRVPSTGWWQTQKRLARVHARIVRIRRDGLHRLTTRLATSHDTIVVERLNVAGMMRNHRLSRVIADAAFGELRRQLTYKTTWYGSVLISADRWYPSSKTCSACGVAKTKLPLSERVFACETCGLVIDRDLNAARNLAALVNDMVAGSGPETRNARGGDRSPGLAGQTPPKREPRTSMLGKTRTVGWQRSAAQIAHNTDD
jgi:putative transposase